MKFLETTTRIIEVKKSHPNSEWEDVKSYYEDFEEFAKVEVEEMDSGIFPANSAELIFQKYSCTKIELY